MVPKFSKKDIVNFNEETLYKEYKDYTIKVESGEITETDNWLYIWEVICVKIKKIVYIL